MSAGLPRPRLAALGLPVAALAVACAAVRPSGTEQTRSTGPVYFVSSAGSDLADGLSPQRAWRTLDRVNGHSFEGGSTVLLRGGDTFEGALTFGPDDAGSAELPVVIGSYGRGRARLRPGESDGLAIIDAGGFEIRDLEIAGPGPANSRGSGLSLVNDLDGDVKLQHIRIDRVGVSGFGAYGVLLQGNKGNSGFADVRITRVTASDNAWGGIAVRGAWSETPTGYAHRDVYIGHSSAHHNPGDPNRRRHSGSGIVVSNVDGAVIEHSQAFANGWKCEADGGGPVGIWAWDSNRVVIQHNQSYRNRVASLKDGGGFDLDGGVSNSVMQYNLSYENDGAGFLMMDFAYGRPYRSNVLRYNISYNDGRRNSYAGIMLMGGINDTEIYNNSVFVSPAAEGVPSALLIASTQMRSRHEHEVGTATHIRNNVLAVTGELPVVSVEGDHPGLLFQGNAYWAGGEDPRFVWQGESLRGLEGWRGAASQERWGQADTGIVSDPGWRHSPLWRPFQAVTSSRYLTELFRLRRGSALVDAALPLERFGLDHGPRDFYGTPLPQRRGLDVGAHELAGF